MQKNTAFRDYLLHDLFADVHDLEIRAMMGGNMIRKSGLAVGILEDGAVFFKVGSQNMEDFERHHAPWFTYPRNGKEVRMNFREVPVDILEDREEVGKWLNLAYEVALLAKRKKKRA